LRGDAVTLEFLKALINPQNAHLVELMNWRGVGTAAHEFEQGKRQSAPDEAVPQHCLSPVSLGQASGD
jgi:hypothetical protein